MAGRLRRTAWGHQQVPPVDAAPGRIRTCGFWLRRPALYPLSYGRGARIIPWPPPGGNHERPSPRSVAGRHGSARPPRACCAGAIRGNLRVLTTMNGLLLCRTGFDAGLAFPATGPSSLIGRAQDCPISVLDDALSRHHARIFVEEGGAVVIEDLGSSLGTEVNGEPVIDGEAMPLAHFDVIRLGKAVELVWIELGRVPLTEVLAASLVGPAGERVPLRVGDNSIGSQDECDLIVPDPSVAARHACSRSRPAA